MRKGPDGRLWPGAGAPPGAIAKVKPIFKPVECSATLTPLVVVARDLQEDAIIEPSPLPIPSRTALPRQIQRLQVPKSIPRAAHAMMSATIAYGEGFRSLEWNQESHRRRGRSRTTLFSGRRSVVGPTGKNIGYETNGKSREFTRPVIILKKYNQYSFLALPLTTAPKPNPYRLPIGMIDGRQAFATLSQLRNTDSKRLVKKIVHLDAGILAAIKKEASRVNFG
jgi:hypothetical protein